MVTPKISAAAESTRRSRIAGGLTAGRIKRAGMSLRAGHLRRARATIRSASCVSIDALMRLRIARRYVRDRRTTRRASRGPIGSIQTRWLSADEDRRFAATPPHRTATLRRRARPRASADLPGADAAHLGRGSRRPRMGTRGQVGRLPRAASLRPSLGLAADPQRPRVLRRLPRARGYRPGAGQASGDGRWRAGVPEAGWPAGLRPASPPSHRLCHQPAAGGIAAGVRERASRWPLDAVAPLPGAPGRCSRSWRSTGPPGECRRAWWSTGLRTSFRACREARAGGHRRQAS